MEGLECNEENFTSRKRLIVDGFAGFIKIVSVNYKCILCNTYIYHNPI